MGLSVHTTGSNVGYWFGTQSRVEQCCAGAPTPSAAHTDNFNAITSSPFGLIGLRAIVPPERHPVPPEHLRDICLSFPDLDSSPSSGRPSGHPPVLDIVPDTLRTPLRSLRLSRRHPLSILLPVTSGAILLRVTSGHTPRLLASRSSGRSGICLASARWIALLKRLINLFPNFTFRLLALLFILALFGLRLSTIISKLRHFLDSVEFRSISTSQVRKLSLCIQNSCSNLSTNVLRIHFIDHGHNICIYSGASGDLHSPPASSESCP